MTEPTDFASTVLHGAVDLHIHSGPDIFPRNVDAISAASQAKEAGMAAIVVKSHSTDTSSRAETARELTGFPVYGGVVLNYAVGGFNEYAVHESARQGGRIVWFPTIGARHFIENVGAGAGELIATAIPRGVDGLTALENGRVKPEVLRVLDAVREHDLTLASGHLSPDETLAVFTEARARGITRLIVTHPKLPFVGMPGAAMSELAEVGAYCEITDHLEIDERIVVIETVGHERVFLSTDGGNTAEPVPVERLRRSALGLREAGLTAEQIHRMVAINPAYLLGV